MKKALLGTRHPRKEKEAALQNKIVEPACLCDVISVCHSTRDGTKNEKLDMEVRRSHIGGVATPPGFAKLVAGCPQQRGAAYQSYLERLPILPPGEGEGGDTYIPKIKLKRGAQCFYYVEFCENHFSGFSQ